MALRNAYAREEVAQTDVEALPDPLASSRWKSVSPESSFLNMSDGT